MNVKDNGIKDFITLGAGLFLMATGWAIVIQKNYDSHLPVSLQNYSLHYIISIYLLFIIYCFLITACVWRFRLGTSLIALGNLKLKYYSFYYI